jgi:hypothetical protein
MTPKILSFCCRIGGILCSTSSLSWSAHTRKHGPKNALQRSGFDPVALAESNRLKPWIYDISHL